jgi:hypothetical protein
MRHLENPKNLKIDFPFYIMKKKLIHFDAVPARKSEELNPNNY